VDLTGTQVEVDPVVRDDRAELLGDSPQLENRGLISHDNPSLSFG